tara:strand:+ start:334 stop:531 length:198 start_codon:yes stop_codon:yes gene_type:complete
MYVCLCNGFTCSQVRCARDEGARSAADVYRTLGCSMKCGKCAIMITELLEEQKSVVKQSSTLQQI